MVTAIAKIARHYQVTVPRDIRLACELKEGDLVNFKVRNREIVMTPVCMIRKDQAYFFSPRWQKAIKKSEEQIQGGHYKTYHSAKELEEDIE